MVAAEASLSELLPDETMRPTVRSVLLHVFFALWNVAISSRLHEFLYRGRREPTLDLNSGLNSRNLPDQRAADAQPADGRIRSLSDIPWRVKCMPS